MAKRPLGTAQLVERVSAYLDALPQRRHTPSSAEIADALGVKPILVTLALRWMAEEAPAEPAQRSAASRA